MLITKEEIIQKLKEIKPLLKQKYNLTEIALFGSYARDEQTEKSDIDILVDFNDRIDGFNYIRLAHELEDLFHHKIDIVSRRGIKARYLPYVEKNLIHV